MWPNKLYISLPLQSGFDSSPFPLIWDQQNPFRPGFRKTEMQLILSKLQPSKRWRPLSRNLGETLNSLPTNTAVVAFVLALPDIGKSDWFANCNHPVLMPHHQENSGCCWWFWQKVLILALVLTGKKRTETAYPKKIPSPGGGKNVLLLKSTPAHPGAWDTQEVFMLHSLHFHSVRKMSTQTKDRKGLENCIVVPTGEPMCNTNR